MNARLLVHGSTSMSMKNETDMSITILISHTWYCPIYTHTTQSHWKHKPYLLPWIVVVYYVGIEMLFFQGWFIKSISPPPSLWQPKSVATKFKQHPQKLNKCITLEQNYEFRSSHQKLSEKLIITISRNQKWGLQTNQDNQMTTRPGKYK